MIVADTTVWADWFNGVSTPAIHPLDVALAAGEIGVPPLVLAEVLQGFKREAGFEQARALLVRLPLLPLDALGYVEAARLFRRLRRVGITIHGTVDCVIAQTCIGIEAELLTTDADFALIARHSNLRLCRN